MIIDCHAHVFPPQIKKNRQKYVAEDPCFAMLYSKSNAKLALRAMEERGYLPIEKPGVPG